MLYKVGDNVIVREDLETWKQYTNSNGSRGIRANQTMVGYGGRSFKIKKIKSGRYLLEDDEHGWYWTDEMFVDDRAIRQSRTPISKFLSK